MKKYFLIFSLLLMLGCTAGSKMQQGKALTIAFGSCNRQNLPQPMWDVIAKDKPDLWIWLGDNIYGDSDDMAVLKAKYDLQSNQEGYKRLTAQTPVIGTWDDHDFGRNDAGKNYPYKKASQQLALDFLKEPANSPRRRQEGIYAAYEYKLSKKKVKVILLDIRYHQDSLQKESNKAYIPNTTGDILGEAQWLWLENQLSTSTADAHIIGSGIQFVSDQHPYEKWANFPAARQRLFDLLVKTKTKGVVLLSGDRHIGEFSRIDINGLDYPVYDITSSGLTHSSVDNTSEPNRYRVGPLVNQKHYGLFRLLEQGGNLVMEVDLKGENGKPFHTEKIEIRN
ncbi:alkaline phosphatase D family protein [Rufibacter tibetensis]|uniref:Alkaline phosphatase n=1 Tax=Rufibacter tibetensis TaxID=512763 RepID=A0A0P0CW06_9BACT|nr:alkaline phosphatase D family protein [Rufibacter tibetensis]ALJ01765.1 alkaline phosphatase [Rufibacter tibetensis]